MKQLVFKTVDGVELYIDTTTGQYEATDWIAIESVLKTYMDNADVYPYAAKMAFDLMQDLVAQGRLTNYVRQSF